LLNRSDAGGVEGCYVRGDGMTGTGVNATLLDQPVEYVVFGGEIGRREFIRCMGAWRPQRSS